MKHVLFAVFDREDEAEQAIREIRESARPGAPIEVNVHDDYLPAHDLSIRETNAREGLIRGVLMGVFGGIIGGLLLGLALDFTGLGGGLGTAVFAALAGAVIGGLGGGLMGSADPDMRLRQVAGRMTAGQVVVTIEAPDRHRGDDVERVVARHGGKLSHKPLA